MAYTSKIPQLTNFSELRLSSGIESAATEIELVSAAGLADLLSGLDYIPVVIRGATANREIVHVVGVSGDTITVLRGQEGTSAASWSTSAYLYVSLTAQAAKDLLVNSWRRPLDDAGSPVHPVYVDGSTFTVAGDHTGEFVPRAAVRVCQGGSIVVPASGAYVVSSAYSDGVTTVAVEGVTLSASLDFVEAGISPGEAPKHPDSADVHDDMLAAKAAQAAAESAKTDAESAKTDAESAKTDAEAAQAAAESAKTDAEAARDAVEAALPSVRSEINSLRADLTAEAFVRAEADASASRSYLGDGWIDTLADDGDVTLSGAEVSGGYMTNAGADNVVTALDLTTAQFLDEKGNITTFTVDTANTSGHFNAANGSRVVAGCRMVISGVSYPITGITGDGTASNAVVLGAGLTLAAGTYTVSGIYGCNVDASGLRLSRSYQQNTTDILTGGTVTASSEYQPAVNVVDNNTATSWVTSEDYPTAAWVKYQLPSAKRAWKYRLNVTQYPAQSPHDWQFQGSNDNTNWTTLDTRSGQTWATAGWKEYTIPEANRGSYLYYRLYVTLGGASGARMWIAEWEVYEEAAVYPVAVYPASLALDCTDWIALKALARTETLNSQNIWYALSFDGGTTYSAYISGAWLPIVRNNAGTWEYWNGSAWAASSINSALGAMAQAAAVEGNRMTGATMAGLSQAQIEGSGGFTGGQTSLPVLAALYSASSTATPVLSAMSMTSDIQPHDMVAEFDAFEAQDPDSGLCVLAFQAVDDVTLDTDLKAWLKRGSGAYVQVPLEVLQPFDSESVLLIGELDMSAGSGTSTQFKLTSHNHKELRIKDAANRFRSA